VAVKIKDYIVSELIGQGRWGDVYAATAPDGQEVAIKVLRDELDLYREAEQRFLREIQIMQTLSHDNIVPILDYGQEDNRLFLVMRRIHGYTLEEVQKNNAFSPQSVAKVVQDIAPAIAVGHKQGLVHRDIKPNNILVERNEAGVLVFYLSDFGLSKRPHIDESVTATHRSVGTPHFMSPEAVSGDQIDTRSDIYSFAAMLYKLLTGAYVFDGNSFYNIIIQHLQSPPPPLTALHPDFPLPLQAVVLKSLAKDPAQRHQTMQELMEHYMQALEELSLQQRQTIYKGAGE
jgi:serine/threonine-protein kinase